MGALDSLIKQPISVDPELVAAAAACVNTTLGPRRLRSSGGGGGVSGRMPEEVGATQEELSVASFEQISSFVDAMNWMQTSFIQTLWQGSGRVNYYYRALGGMHVRFQETTLTQCTRSEYLGDFYGRDCRSLDDDSLITTEMWLDFRNSAASEAKRSAETLCGPRLLSPATSSMRAQSLLYNGEVAFLVLMTASFSQDVVGSFERKLKFCELGEIYHTWLRHLGDIIWSLLLMYFFVSECRRVGNERIKKRPWRQILNWWTVINVCIFFSSIGIASFWIYFSLALQGLGEDIHRHGGDLTKIREVYNRVDKLCEEQSWNETFQFWYAQMLMVKFFQAFQVNARLNVISVTIQKSAKELAHFALISGLVFLNYALGAHLLFGKHIKEWSTFRDAVNMTFLVLMGDFDFAAMYAVAPLSSQLWFWTFMMLVFMIMLNMLLVIVMDVYAQVKDKVHNTETLYAQAVALFESVSQDIAGLSESDDGQLRHSPSKSQLSLSGSSVNSQWYEHWLEKVANAIEHPRGVIIMDDADSDAGQDPEPDFINAGTLIEMGCPAHRALLIIEKAGAFLPPRMDDKVGVLEDVDDVVHESNEEIEEPEPEDAGGTIIGNTARAAKLAHETSQEIKVDPAELRARLNVLSKQMREMRTKSRATWAQVQDHLELMVLQHDIGKTPELWSTTSLDICTKATKQKRREG